MVNGNPETAHPTADSVKTYAGDHKAIAANAAEEEK